MSITFGIITDGNNMDRVSTVVNSIDSEVPECNIIVVGSRQGYDVNLDTGKHLLMVPFKEVPGKGWITKKKNLITHLSCDDVIVYMHDYVTLARGWWEGYQKQPCEEWQLQMHKIENKDGTRFRDWCHWDSPQIGNPWVCREKWCPEFGIRFQGPPALIPYIWDNLHPYISGAYWVAHRTVMEEYPLNEELYWGEGEDVEWSLRWREDMNVDYCLNEHCTVKLLKQKPQTFKEITW